MKWCFVGSGPSAPAQVDAILPLLRPCRTISCNAAIKLLSPDVYFLADQVACRRYVQLALAARTSAGTHLVTMHRYRQALEQRGVQDFDEFLINGVDPPLPERWGAYNMSGAICLEYACRHGATEIHLLGCEGYTDERSYFDQDDRDTEFKIADSLTTKQLVKRTMMVVECFKDVRFMVHGPTHYTIPLPNWYAALPD